MLTFEFVDGQDALLGFIRPEDGPLENGETRSCRNVGRSADDQEPIVAIVVDGLDVVEERVAPEDPLGR